MLFWSSFLAFEKRGMASKPNMTDGAEARKPIYVNHAVERLKLKVKSFHAGSSAV